MAEEELAAVDKHYRHLVAVRGHERGVRGDVAGLQCEGDAAGCPRDDGKGLVAQRTRRLLQQQDVRPFSATGQVVRMAHVSG